MPRRQEASYENRLVDSLVDDLLADGDRIAADMGAPADTRRPTATEEDDIWDRTDPAVDYPTLVARLLSGGLPPEEAQQLKLVQLFPETLAAFAQPLDPVTADALARAAEHPYRHQTYQHLDPGERVAYAKARARASAKRQAERAQAPAPSQTMAPVAPAPPLPPTAPPAAPAAPSIPPTMPLPLGG